MKCNTVLRTAVGDRSLVTHFQIPSLSYANQTDNQKHKAIRFLDTSTLLAMKVHVVFCLK
jgi:hypothetical protein